MKQLVRRVRDERGQMTVELVVVLPIFIIVAVIAINALDFFSFCASFDRAAHNAVRLYAVSPAYGQDAVQSSALVEQSLQGHYQQDENVEIAVESGVLALGLREFKATARYHPTLFGLKLCDEVLGVPLPCLTHATRFVVDCYKPGVVV